MGVKQETGREESLIQASGGPEPSFSFLVSSRTASASVSLFRYSFRRGSPVVAGSFHNLIVLIKFRPRNRFTFGTLALRTKALAIPAVASTHRTSSMGVCDANCAMCMLDE